MIVSPLASQPGSWLGVALQVWASRPRLAGWFTTSALHSLRGTHTRPRQASRRNPRLSQRPGVPSRSASAVGLLWGPAGRREEPNFSWSLFRSKTRSSSPRLSARLRLWAVPGLRQSRACGSRSPLFSAHLRVPQSTGLLRALRGVAWPRHRREAPDCFQPPGDTSVRTPPPAPLHTAPSSCSFSPAAKVTWNKAGRTVRAQRGGGSPCRPRRRH